MMSLTKTHFRRYDDFMFCETNWLVKVSANGEPWCFKNGMVENDWLEIGFPQLIPILIANFRYGKRKVKFRGQHVQFVAVKPVCGDVSFQQISFLFKSFIIV